MVLVLIVIFLSIITFHKNSYTYYLIELQLNTLKTNLLFPYVFQMDCNVLLSLILHLIRENIKNKITVNLK